MSDNQEVIDFTVLSIHHMQQMCVMIMMTIPDWSSTHGMVDKMYTALRDIEYHLSEHGLD